MPNESQKNLHPQQQDKKKRKVREKILFIVFLVTVTLATTQLIQGNQHIKNKFHSRAANTITDKKDGFMNVKDRLRKFLQRRSVNQVNKKIDSSSLEISHDIYSNNTSSVNPLVSIFEKSGISLTPNILEQIPPYSNIIKMYGNKPTVIGLERCEEFQQQVQPPDRTLAVAGMFNTGTNLLERLLFYNCANPFRKVSANRQDKAGILWQVAWGKHSPASFRLIHKNSWSKGLNEMHALPIVVTKDPYSWMESLCRHPYSAQWKHSEQHCPNLIPNEVDISMGYIKSKEEENYLIKEGIPLSITYASRRKVTHANLVDAWNTWYGDYIEAKYPRLIVRFEDLLFHTEMVITQACRCFGGRMINESYFTYHVDSAKPDIGAHRGGYGLTEALLKYSDVSNRVKPLTNDDLVFANKVLNKTMMELFQYSVEDAIS